MYSLQTLFSSYSIFSSFIWPEKLLHPGGNHGKKKATGNEVAWVNSEANKEKTVGNYIRNSSPSSVLKSLPSSGKLRRKRRSWE